MIDLKKILTQVSMEDFELLKVLGRGAFGKVVLCKEKESSALYAMKILKKTMVCDKNEVSFEIDFENIMFCSVRWNTH